MAAKSAHEQEHAVFDHALFSRSGFDDKLRAEARRNSRLTLYSLAEIVRGAGTEHENGEGDISV